MSAEAVTVKKRGRPAKKAVSPTTDNSNNVIVEVDAVPTSPLTPQQKTRGKSGAGSDVAAVPTAKKSSSTTESKKVKSETGRSAAVSTSKPAAAASTTTTTTRKRSVKTSTATTAAAVEEKLPSSSSRTKTLKAESVEVPEDPPVVAEKAASPVKVAAAASTEKLAAQAKKQMRSTKAQESQSASSLPEQQTKAEPVSEILQQARAFTKTSSSDEVKKSTSTRPQVLDRKAEQPASTSEPMEPAISANQVLDSILAQAEAKQPSTADMDSTLEAPKQGTKSTATTPSSSSSTPPPSSLPSKLLTTNPLFTATRPKYTLPYSTTAALASRHQQQEEQKQKQHSAQRAVRRTGAGGGFRSSRPPPTDPAAAGDRNKAPPMSHDEIRKTPQYRETNARVRRVIVALPIAIVSSYYLYQRRDEQRVYEERLLALGRGGAGAAAGSSAQGVSGNLEGSGAAGAGAAPASNGRAE